MKKLPIGISDFRKLIRDNNYFVDKSMLISELINSNAQVLLMPRPRRFGKTLNLSMLRYFFERGDDSSYLFEDLKIRESREFKEHINRYPVIFLSFKDIKSSSFDDTLEGVSDLIAREYERHYDMIKDIDKSIREERIIDSILNCNGSKKDYEISLELLSKLLYRAYNQEVIILIDEYDTPIHASYINGYYGEFIEFIRNLLSGAFKDNSYLYRGVITGILRVSRESIFSGLNNLATYTILESEFSDSFGFTIDETRDILEYFNLQDRYDDISDSYNGYTFGTHTILNPWSIINYISDRDHRLLAYWANTSSNELIKHLLSVSSLNFKKSMESWLKDETIVSEIDSNIVFSEIERSDQNIYSLLFFSGYLKCVDKELIDKKYRCRLAVPNTEVKYIFDNIVSSWINESYRVDRLGVLLSSLTSGDIRLFEELFSEFVLETLSFYDLSRRNEEAVYHAFLLGILISLDDYEVISNRESGLGRVDIILLHKEDRDKLAIIMELKSINKFREKDKDEALTNALIQIDEKRYEVEVKRRGYNNILKMGVVFDGKRVWVKM